MSDFLGQVLGRHLLQTEVDIATVLQENPNRNLQVESEYITRKDYIVSYLVDILHKTAHNAVNFDKLKGTTQN